jgi:hypothetical protein
MFKEIKKMFMMFFHLDGFVGVCFQVRDLKMHILTQLRHHVLRIEVEHKMIMKIKIVWFYWHDIMLHLDAWMWLTPFMSKGNETRILRWEWVATID